MFLLVVYRCKRILKVRISFYFDRISHGCVVKIAVTSCATRVENLSSQIAAIFQFSSQTTTNDKFITC